MEHPLQLYSEYRHQFDVKRTNRGEERDPGVRNEHLQDFLKKIWEIRCHEWTNFFIKLDYKTTHRNPCPSAISTTFWSAQTLGSHRDDSQSRGASPLGVELPVRAG